MTTATVSTPRALHGLVNNVGYRPGPQVQVGARWYTADAKLFADLNYHLGHDRKVHAVVRGGHVVAIMLDGDSKPVVGRLEVHNPGEIVVGGHILRHHGSIPNEILSGAIGKTVVAKVNGDTVLDVFEAVVTRGRRLFGGVS